MNLSGLLGPSLPPSTLPSVVWSSLGSRLGGWGLRWDQGCLDPCFSWRCPGGKETLLPLGLEPRSNLPALISKTVPGSAGNRQAPTLRNLFLHARPRALLLHPATGPALGQLSLSSVLYCPKRLVPGRGGGEQPQALLLDMCGSGERGER